MVEYIEEVKLVAVREGNYTNYVFKNLDTGKYIMCTKLPNWQTPNINVNDVGFLQYQIVKAGDEYYNVNLDTTARYLYSNSYFKNFVLKSETLQNNNEIIL